MSAAVTIEPAHLAEVRRVLTQHLPPDVAVAVFGSRAGGRVRTWSDLDLVLDAGTPLPLSLLADLAEAFEESALPWQVDLIDRRGVGDAFGAVLDRTSLPLP